MKLANYFDCFVHFFSEKVTHLENTDWLQAGAEFITWDKWIWDKSPLYFFILAAKDDMLLFCSLCPRSNKKELCIGVPMPFKGKFLPPPQPSFSSWKQHLGLQMRAVFDVLFTVMPAWLWIPELALILRSIPCAQALISLPWPCFILFFLPFFAHFFGTEGLVGEASFHFRAGPEGRLADLTCRVSAALNEHAQITVNPYLHIINTRI